jgi:hypothetical protein
MYHSIVVNNLMRIWWVPGSYPVSDIDGSVLSLLTFFESFTHGLVCRITDLIYILICIVFNLYIYIYLFIQTKEHVIMYIRI